MTAISSPYEPNSDDLAELYTSTDAISTTTAPTDLSDDLDALNELEAESKRAKVAAGDPIHHRTWKTSDVFRSEPVLPGSSPVQMPTMTSSPPLTPSPQKKRKFADLDFGKSALSRPLKAQKVYYGIDIHRLLGDAQAEASIPRAAYDLPTPPAEAAPSKRPSLLWTEKYRAKRFTDLIGEERTHRAVMHWLKRWDQIVFPGSYRPKPKRYADGHAFEEKPHRKILMLTGPPGLGKTTLAHVCARQAGYEVQEINASDERSSAVVKGRIRDMVGTENVKGVDNKAVDGKAKKAAKPVCVIVDEVDGVVSGSGGSGEGGFVKALIDLIMLDQKNSNVLGTLPQAPARTKKGDRFRLLRPIILVCNDVYHPSLRPLRQSTIAEVIHVRKPQIQTLVTRLQNIFEKEGVSCDGDGVRRLCEAAWGVTNRKEDRNRSGAGEGDMRGILVVGEWVAGKLRATSDGSARLTRKWVEENVLNDLQYGGGAARGLGRGGPKDIVERVFKEGAGFPKQTAMATPEQSSNINSVKGVAEGLRRTATQRLRELVDTHGDTDRVVTDCYTMYPEYLFQDDTLLSKPDAAYEWLHFHDKLSSAVYSSNEWELAPYLSAPVLGFHHLFSSATRAQYTAVNDADEDTTPSHPFSGPSASWAAHEAGKQNAAHIQTLQSGLSLPLARAFTSTADIATDLQPYLFRMLSPNINPVVVGGSGKDKSTASVRKASEQSLVKRAVNAMGATGVRFDRVKLSFEDSGPAFGANQWIYRMEPPLDSLCTFNTGEGLKVRYAVRQVLEQEWSKEEKRLAEEQRMARSGGVSSPAAAEPSTKRGAMDEGPKKIVARDFFGRPIAVPVGGEAVKSKASKAKERQGPSVWVTYHEGYSNAVRKPLTLAELMKDL
ncbi:Chromosome transmission fidelity 18 [Lecanosticta acicola]|uniref:Chromosome transmission fidelity 18 n=1 Tax=Lecanosticta acicola TaxID=111012 RepID=A0AAI8Z950_9PEZI|nr:Chromosome transmission fidelity 18 [Lecanosticta acicola]